MSGPSAYLIGVRELDGEFARMLQIKLYCDKMQVSYPQEVSDYLGDVVTQSEAYIRAQLEEIHLIGLDGDGIKAWGTSIPYEVCDGGGDRCVEIALNDLPERLKGLKLRMTW